MSGLSHSQRGGAILLALLLGPAPISVVLFIVGTSPVALGGVLTAIGALIVLMIALYIKNRRVAAREGLEVLPASQIAALLSLIASIAGATFFLPNDGLAHWGFLCVVIGFGIVYVMGIAIRRQQSDPDERSAVLVLALMALLIALANAGV